MNRRLASGFCTSLLAFGFTSVAFGQGVPPAPPPAPPPYNPGQPQPTYAPPPPQGGYAPAQPMYQPPAPPRVIAVSDASEGESDHQLAVGKMGIEAMTLAPGGGFPVTNAVGVRMWQTPIFAWNADLAFSLAGGSDATGKSFDTAFAVGPNGGVSILLANWKHMAISFSPQATFGYYTPGTKGAKSTIFVSLRAPIEAEVHFGFIHLPGLSAGVNAGPAFNYVGTGDASAWGLGMYGPSSLDTLRTTAFLRYYL